MARGQGEGGCGFVGCLVSFGVFSERFGGIRGVARRTLPPFLPLQKGGNSGRDWVLGMVTFLIGSAERIA